MKTRCYNPRQKGFHNYGGRGIVVCERWLHSFANFLTDMGPKPTPKHTVERLDSNGHYEPGNVRWATMLEQAHNRRNNRKLTHAGETLTTSGEPVESALERAPEHERLLTFNGETLSVTQWAKRLGLRRETVNRRLNNKGWPIEKALRPRIDREHKLSFNGITLSVSAWARRLGVTNNALFGRLRRSWPLDGALSA